MSAWIWLVGGILLSIAEVLGAEFVLLMLGGGALITAGFAAFFPDLLWLQVLVFALSSVALVLGLRPMLLRKYYQPSQTRTGIDAIIAQLDRSPADAKAVAEAAAAAARGDGNGETSAGGVIFWIVLILFFMFLFGRGGRRRAGGSRPR